MIFVVVGSAVVAHLWCLVVMVVPKEEVAGSVVVAKYSPTHSAVHQYLHLSENTKPTKLSPHKTCLPCLSLSSCPTQRCPH